MSELVLPNGLTAYFTNCFAIFNACLFQVEAERKANDFSDNWRVKFLRRANWCGFKLLDQRGFEDWIRALSSILCYTKDAMINMDIMEKFIRDYLPKDGYVPGSVVNYLCHHNGGEYLRELWQEAKHKFKTVSDAGRFDPDDFLWNVCMLNDFEFFKMAYDEFVTPNTSINLYFDMLENSYHSFKEETWKNFRYLVENRQITRDMVDFVDFEYLDSHHGVELAIHYWEMLPFVKSHDKDMVLTAIRSNNFLLLFVDESFRKDKDIVMEAADLYAEAFQFAHESLRKDKDFVMNAIYRDACLLEYFHESLRKDRDVVMAAIQNNSDPSFEIADESLRNDKEIAMAAISRVEMDFSFADVGPSLRKDKEIVRAVIEKHRIHLQKVSDPPRNEKHLAGLRRCFGREFQYADATLRKDKDFVMEAVELYGNALEYVHESLRKDKDIVLAAFRNDGMALLFADESLQRDPEVVLEAIKRDKESIKFAEKSLFQDEQFLLQAVELDESCFNFASELLRKDKEFVTKAVKRNGKSLSFADESLRNDPELLLEAAKHDEPLPEI